MIFMSIVTIVIIVVAVLVVPILVIGVMAVMRSRRLQGRFLPEYDRLIGQRDSKLKAESELAGRKRRVDSLDIDPLTDSARATYTQQWAAIQERFVDTPADAVAASQVLVAAVMGELGYPAEDHDQVLTDLSVEHASTLARYRAAEQVSGSAAAGTASTEDLRVAMTDYRALFRALVGEPVDADLRPAAPERAPMIEADGTTRDMSDTPVADGQPEMAAVGLDVDAAGPEFSRTNSAEMTK
jgi:hypothetical protein